MQFIADAMLGALAKWLRLLGYDTLFAGDLPVSDDDILRIAIDERRILLTRDKELFKRAKSAGVQAYLIESSDVEHQLAQLAKDGVIELKEEPSTLICPRCNGKLVVVSKKEVVGSVPTTILDTHDEFWRCTNCGQIYWKGTHWARMRELIERVREIISTSSAPR